MKCFHIHQVVVYTLRSEFSYIQTSFTKKALSDEQRETLQSLIDPTAKFFEEKNDALKNDLNEKIPDDVLQGLKDLGAFGLQVPQEQGGLGKEN
jgi:very long chain acyl-CoA dehydrogenase